MNNKMKPKKGERRVKGYAVVTESGVFVEAYTSLSDANAVIAIALNAGIGRRKAFPCTITYQLPTPKRVINKKSI